MYGFDLYGMGCSYSDKKAPVTSPDTALEVYTRSIEEWRLDLKIDEFFILGHSLGAYMTTHYLKRYSPKVKGVFMMSCAGMNTMPDGEITKMLTNRGWFKGNIIKYFLYLIEIKHWNINKIFYFVNVGTISKKYFSRDILGMSAEEAELMSKLPQSIFDMEPSGHKLLGWF